MRFAQVAGLTALVYISLVKSEFLLSYSNEPIYKKDLTEREVHTANGLVNKSVFKRVKREGEIAFVRNTQINESNIKVRMPLTESSEIPRSYKIYKERIAKIAKELGIPYARLAAHLHQESSFNHTDDKTGKTLTGDKGTAIGIGQIRELARKDVEKYLGRKVDLHDPEDNIRVAGVYWKLQKEKYGAKTDDQASRMYNAGPTPKGDAGLQYQQDIIDKMELYKQKQDYATPIPKQKTQGVDAPEPRRDEPVAQVSKPKYGTVEWYKKYGTDPNPAFDA